jgi:hypothetical protein
MEIKEIKKLKKNLPRFYCEKCDFLCYMKCDWERHIMRAKHLSSVTGNDLEIKKLKKTYSCDCGKIFKTNSGLWKHEKACKTKKTENEIVISKKTNLNDEEMLDMIIQDNKDLKNILMEQMKENNELKNMMMKVIENGTHNTYNNSNNKTFNLQVFLNETCKDAMNIMDFVNSMEIELDDLEKVGELGYVNGMTNIILKNLKALDVTKRPVHCTDAKREILYIKDDNKWEKETENKDKMKLALKYIVHKNAKMFNVFKAKYPDCIKSYSTRCDQYNKLVVEVLGGKGDNENQNNEKIIRRIAREVTIDKDVQL